MLSGMLFPFFHNRRKQILAEPFPDGWRRYLDENVRLYGHLEADEQTRLREIAKVLVREKNWEGCQGLALTEEMPVTIAAQAALLIVNLDHDYYANVESILLYPASYRAVEYVGSGRIVTEMPVDRLGEAWSGNLPLILSWPEALAGGRNENSGRNVVLHEFAHKLDNRDGVVDGVPRLGSDTDYERWSNVMSREFERLKYMASIGHPTLLDWYGAKSPAEFFAVSTECFFGHPIEMRRHHPDLYAVLGAYYRQDPAARLRWRG